MTKNEDINKEEELKEKEEDLKQEDSTENQCSDESNKDREIEELNSKLVRLQADFVNFKKRAEKDKESTIIYSTEEFLCQLLPILDNFERAIESEANKDEGFYQGVEMIYQQLIKLLNDNGVEEINAVGETFDPNYHHAVFMEESTDHKEGTIIEVFQKGYVLKDKVIRPSMVKVAK